MLSFRIMFHQAWSFCYVHCSLPSLRALTYTVSKSWQPLLENHHELRVKLRRGSGRRPTALFDKWVEPPSSSSQRGSSQDLPISLAESENSFYRESLHSSSSAHNDGSLKIIVSQDSDPRATPTLFTHWRMIHKSSASDSLRDPFPPSSWYLPRLPPLSLCGKTFLVSQFRVPTAWLSWTGQWGGSMLGASLPQVDPRSPEIEQQSCLWLGPRRLWPQNKIHFLSTKPKVSLVSLRNRWCLTVMPKTSVVNRIKHVIILQKQR